MIARPGQTGWQTILADLSLILFMITASALSVAEAPHPASAAPKAAAPRPVTPSARAEPVGVWREAEGAPPLANWLAEQGSDPRLRLSIVVRYLAGEGRRDAALDRAAALAAQAGPGGRARGWWWNRAPSPVPARRSAMTGTATDRHMAWCLLDRAQTVRPSQGHRRCSVP